MFRMRKILTRFVAFFNHRVSFISRQFSYDFLNSFHKISMHRTML